MLYICSFYIVLKKFIIIIKDCKVCENNFWVNILMKNFVNNIYFFEFFLVYIVYDYYVLLRN